MKEQFKDMHHVSWLFGCCVFVSPVSLSPNVPSFLHRAAGKPGTFSFNLASTNVQLQSRGSEGTAEHARSFLCPMCSIQITVQFAMHHGHKIGFPSSEASREHAT